MGTRPPPAIEAGTTQRQRTLFGTLASLPERAAAHGFDTPMITVIGGVTLLPGAGLDWFRREMLRNSAAVV